MKKFALTTLAVMAAVGVLAVQPADAKKLGRIQRTTDIESLQRSVHIVYAHEGHSAVLVQAAQCIGSGGLQMSDFV